MQSTDYARIEKAIRYIDESYQLQPLLEEVARHVGLSDYHFQRLFSRWAGVSPKRFLQFVTARHARDLLDSSRTVLDAAYDAGLSGPGRLHDLMVSVDAMTPGEVKRRGAGLVIRYGYHDSPFGECIVATTDRGLCGLEFLGDAGPAAALESVRARWPAASFVPDPEASGEIASRVFDTARGGAPLPLYLQGTNFQIKVWEALLRIPAGEVATYGEIAGRVCSTRAARAVGAAIGRNPIAFVVPCHRVIRTTGAFGEYHWGADRKRALLAWESARRA